MAKKTELLTTEEIFELISAAQSGSEEAANILVSRNQRLVFHVLKRIYCAHVSQEDLVQIGNIGLLKAIQKFDLNKGVRFGTYAVPCIFGEVMRFLRDDGVVKVSRPIKDLAIKIANSGLVNLNTQEVIDALNLTEKPETVHLALTFMENRITISTEAAILNEGTDEEILLKDTYHLSNDLNGDNWMDNIDLAEAMKVLDEREQRIIYLRYFEDRTQDYAAADLGVSQTHIYRLEKRALNKLRDTMLYGGTNFIEENEAEKHRREMRERAIELLKSTTDTYAHISEVTGLSTATISELARKHRPEHMRNKGKRKGTLKLSANTKAKKAVTA
ncbi:RNA polymerase sigma factor [Bacillus phage 035JT004]|nr:RNA polymerase sigma factor [Bacillus phage 035JT004]